MRVQGKSFLSEVLARVEFARDIAFDAGRMLLAKFGHDLSLWTKGLKTDIVTDADIASQELLVGKIKRTFPDDGILSEEGASRSSSTGFVWVVDPLDGTKNFANGIPLFAVSVGITFQGRPVAGAVYAPAMGELFWGAEGQKAYLNGRTITCSSKGMIDALLGTGFANRVDLAKLNMAVFEAFLGRVRAVRRFGCASLNICYVACGRLEGYWDLTPSPWDICAGVAIAKSARATVTDLEGKEVAGTYRGILASCPEIHEDMKRLISNALGDRIFEVPETRCWPDGLENREENS